ncbi:MAG TPA: phosphate transport system regulatory protein PhoU [Deltaproteobacteria bacterium]|nr:phosphate transport system regulatory protein PhoU [Deltaproteobacteria bacterium]
MNVEHTSKQYQADLRELKEKLLSMGWRIESVIQDAMQALIQRDSALAQKCIEGDREVDRLEKEVDELCLKILALRQPTAVDLRFITLGLKIVADLERVGDLGVNIAERALELNQEPPLKPFIDLPKMAEDVQAMLKAALDAFVGEDVALAQKVLQSDDKIDELNHQIFEELVDYMGRGSANIKRACRLMFISRYLERIADHATNVAEMVIFLVQGRDVRHTFGG